MELYCVMNLDQGMSAQGSDFRFRSEGKEKKKNRSAVNVEFHKGAWIVRNDGDSAILFTAPDREKAKKFAEEMSAHHKIEIKIFEKEEQSSPFPPKKEKLKVDVEKRNGLWVVRKNGADENLFTSKEKSEALEFANKLDEGQGLDLHIDKD